MTPARPAETRRALAVRDHVAALFAAARARAPHAVFIGEAELYCRNADCPIRYVTITTKEYDGPTPVDLRCPACRRPLACHHVRTLAESEAVKERRARGRVNAQRYVEAERRRLGDPHALVLIPLSAFLDESLPGERECPGAAP
jgi:hypothetical protein